MIRAERKRLAAEIFISRRDRDAAFPGMEGGFGEPAWDMLLVLYIADAEGGALPTKELLRAAHVESEIAQPYVTWLIAKGLAGYVDDTGIVRLLDAGREMMDGYLDRRGTRGRDRNFMH